MLSPLLPVLMWLAVLQAAPAPTNMLVNGDASHGTAGWQIAGIPRSQGVATIEQIDGVPCFTIRSRGAFAQEVELPVSSSGTYAVIVGRGQSERINAGPSITGLPYLYGMVLSADRKRVLAYWQGQRMLARPERPGQWVLMSGVFRVPPDAAVVSVQLRQAEYKDDPQDGSAARFADVRMVLFGSEEAARAYAAAYR